MSGARYDDLRALFINCTLKRSPEPSHTQGLIDVSAQIMTTQGVAVDHLRTCAITRRRFTVIVLDRRDCRQPVGRRLEDSGRLLRECRSCAALGGTRVRERQRQPGCRAARRDRADRGAQPAVRSRLTGLGQAPSARR